MPVRTTVRQRIVIVAALVVLLGLVLAVCLGPGRVGVSEDDRPAQSANGHSATKSHPSQPEALSAPNVIATELAGEAPSASPAVSAPSNAPAEAAKPVRKDYTILQFQTRTGAPAAGVKILISYHTRAQVSEPGSRAEMETDAEGRIKVLKPADFMFAFRVVPEDWRVRPPARAERDGWYRSTPGWPVVLDHLRFIEVTIHYADGLPYDGTLTLAPYDADNPEAVGLPREETEVVNGRARLTVSADYRDFNVAALSRRPGFDPATAGATAKAPIGDRLNLVLERAKLTFGVIEIDLSAFKQADTTDLAVFRRASVPDCAYHVKASGGGVHATTAIEPGDYTVYVREIPPGRKEWTDAAACTLRTWRSQTVRVDAGQTTRVVAAVQVAAAVKARIVNENGEPLSPGSLSFETGDKQPMNWQLLPSRHRAGTGLSDSNGEALLANVAPGRYKLSVEAKGYDISWFERDLASGQVMDLGTVVLKPASGVIEVEIVNWDPNLKYTITLYQYLSMPLEFRIPMKGPTHRFERLSLRWYSVSVENADKQVGSHSKNARLSEKQPTIKLKFEMSKPPLPDSVPDPEPKED